MSTPAIIGIVDLDQNGAPSGWRAIYCHWGGYPGEVGWLLQTFYDRPATETLVAGGAVSRLGPDPRTPEGATLRDDSNAPVTLHYRSIPGYESQGDMASAGQVEDYPLHDRRGEFWASNPWRVFWQYLLAPGPDGSGVWLCARAGRQDGRIYQPVPLADALAGIAPADWELAGWEIQPPRFNRFRLTPDGVTDLDTLVTLSPDDLIAEHRHRVVPGRGNDES